ncbi:hypothetical protein EK21DRAFT_110977 [Setomelanomma holmii]|uniref:Uncharacterized protein n=1 Tax=Setomelanomma holmii TaxID=210430 RepID=A0A9P4HB94_9PLEO|nr:hypothetical protein EK21DRAFT_110977 [Setomelanomma holmii]
MAPPQPDQPPHTNSNNNNPATIQQLIAILLPALRVEIRAIIPEVVAETIHQMQELPDPDEDTNTTNANEDASVNPNPPSPVVDPVTGRSDPSPEFLAQLREKLRKTLPIEEDRDVRVRTGLMGQEKGYSSGAVRDSGEAGGDGGGENEIGNEEEEGDENVDEKQEGDRNGDEEEEEEEDENDDKDAEEDDDGVEDGDDDAEYAASLLRDASLK